MGPSRPRDADGAALVAPLELRLDSERSRTREADRQGDGRNREYRDADRALALSRWLDRIRLDRRDGAAGLVRATVLAPLLSPNNSSCAGRSNRARSREFRAQVGDVDLPQRFRFGDPVQRIAPQASEGDAF